MLVALGALVAALGGPAVRASRGADGDEELIKQYTSSFQQLAQSDAASKALDEESQWCETARPEVLQVLDAINHLSLQQSLAGMLEKNDEAVRQALTRATGELTKQEDALLDAWRPVLTDLNVKRGELFEVEADQRLTGQLAFLLSVDNRWFWLSGVAAIGALAAVVAHDRRHEFRRWLSGGKARAMGLSKVIVAVLVFLVLVTLATFLCGNCIYNSLLAIGVVDKPSPEEQLRRQNRTIQQKLAASQQQWTEADARCRSAWEAWQKRLPTSFSADWKLPKLWKDDVRPQIRQAAVSLKVQEALAAQGSDDVKSLVQVQSDVKEVAKQRDQHYRRRHLIQGGLGLGLIGLTAVGGIVFQRGRRRRQAAIRRTCPLCLAEGTFEPVDGEADDDFQGREMVRCINDISGDRYGECGFTFLSMYRDMSKLCFPTLGLPSAGKTHWLTMTYRELMRGNYADMVQFKKVRSHRVEADARVFDDLVNQILTSRIRVSATAIDRLPAPLVFNFADRDAWGRSNVLVNIFDYSGEVTGRQTLADRQRRRALDGDGFLFFLDPTKPSEEQAKALEDFSEDLLHIKKGARIGKEIRTPVALCVSKIDLMVKQPYSRRSVGIIDDFYQALEKIGWQGSLSSLEARSKLVADLHDTIWPGWQIERKIHDLFGGRYLFFPLTPVGIDGRGEEDLSQRTIAPRGLLEPLLWLLHMNGYPVFPRRGVKPS
jgi:hypothetical protein